MIDPLFPATPAGAGVEHDQAERREVLRGRALQRPIGVEEVRVEVDDVVGRVLDDEDGDLARAVVEARDGVGRVEEPDAVLLGREARRRAQRVETRTYSLSITVPVSLRK